MCADLVGRSPQATSPWLRLRPGGQPVRHGRSTSHRGIRSIVAASGYVQHSYVQVSRRVNIVNEDLKEPDDRDRRTGRGAQRGAIVDRQGYDAVAGGDNSVGTYD